MSVHDVDSLAFFNVNDAVGVVGLEKETVLSSNLYSVIEDGDKPALEACIGKLKVDAMQ